jgi:hypothetical protein
MTEKFLNYWEVVGRNAYFIADQEKIGKTSKIIDAIKEKLRAP